MNMRSEIRRAKKRPEPSINTPQNWPEKMEEVSNLIQKFQYRPSRHAREIVEQKRQMLLLSLKIQEKGNRIAYFHERFTQKRAAVEEAECRLIKDLKHFEAHFEADKKLTKAQMWEAEEAIKEKGDLMARLQDLNEKKTTKLTSNAKLMEKLTTLFGYKAFLDAMTSKDGTRTGFHVPDVGKVPFVDQGKDYLELVGGAIENNLRASALFGTKNYPKDTKRDFKGGNRPSNKVSRQLSILPDSQAGPGTPAAAQVSPRSSPLPHTLADEIKKYLPNIPRNVVDFIASDGSSEAAPKFPSDFSALVGRLEEENLNLVSKVQEARANMYQQEQDFDTMKTSHDQAMADLVQRKRELGNNQRRKQPTRMDTNRTKMAEAAEIERVLGILEVLVVESCGFLSQNKEKTSLELLGELEVLLTDKLEKIAQMGATHVRKIMKTLSDERWRLRMIEEATREMTVESAETGKFARGALCLRPEDRQVVCRSFQTIPVKVIPGDDRAAQLLREETLYFS
jgi:hypothetical protein